MVAASQRNLKNRSVSLRSRGTPENSSKNIKFVQYVYFALLLVFFFTANNKCRCCEAKCSLRPARNRVLVLLGHITIDRPFVCCISWATIIFYCLSIILLFITTVIMIHLNSSILNATFPHSAPPPSPIRLSNSLWSGFTKCDGLLKNACIHFVWLKLGSWIQCGRFSFEFQLRQLSASINDESSKHVQRQIKSMSCSSPKDYRGFPTYFPAPRMNLRKRFMCESANGY